MNALYVTFKISMYKKYMQQQIWHEFDWSIPEHCSLATFEVRVNSAPDSETIHHLCAAG
jgi:hypothetical protein